MSTLKISQLTTIADVAVGDAIPINDVDQGITAKVTIAQLDTRYGSPAHGVIFSKCASGAQVTIPAATLIAGDFIKLVCGYYSTLGGFANVIKINTTTISSGSYGGGAGTYSASPQTIFLYDGTSFIAVEEMSSGFGDVVHVGATTAVSAASPVVIGVLANANYAGSFNTVIVYRP